MKKLLKLIPLLTVLFFGSTSFYNTWGASKEFLLSYSPDWVYKFTFKLKLNVSKDGTISAEIKDVKPAIPQAYIWMRFNTNIDKVFWYNKCIYIKFNVTFKGQGRAASIPFDTAKDPRTYKWDGPQKGFQKENWDQNSMGVDSSFCIKEYPELSGIKSFKIIQPKEFVWQSPSQLYQKNNRLSEIKGIVMVKKVHGKWVKAKKGMILKSGDRIKTLSNSYAEISLGEGSIIKVKPGTQVVINKEDEKEVSIFELTYGVIMAQANKRKKSLKIATPNAICGIRGTVFEVYYEPSTKMSCVKVFKHSVWFSDAKKRKTVIVKENMESCILGKGIPSKPRLFK